MIFPKTSPSPSKGGEQDYQYVIDVIDFMMVLIIPIVVALNLYVFALIEAPLGVSYQ